MNDKLKAAIETIYAGAIEVVLEEQNPMDLRLELKRCWRLT